jgi:hypothetical protein
VAILGMNVSLYILNYHSRLHFRHSQRFRMLAPHQYKQVFVVELVSFAFHLVLNHFCAQSLLSQLRFLSWYGGSFLLPPGLILADDFIASRQ